MRFRLKGKWYNGHLIVYREGTSDEGVIRSNLDRTYYQRVSSGFYVEPGEHWLDLGANIGAFAVFCKTKGATATCYEPLPDNYRLLLKNASPFECHRTVVTNFQEEELTLYGPIDTKNFQRGSVDTFYRCKPLLTVPNLYAGKLPSVDGVKMDIEGAELGIIDNRLIPSCRKLVMEYHTSRDDSRENLARRIVILKSKFQHVYYPPEYDRFIAGGKAPEYDRFIFCWNNK